eukprot:scaffold276139_cov22-Tisochrysis_lutea.AAC.1
MSSIVGELSTSAGTVPIFILRTRHPCKTALILYIEFWAWGAGAPDPQTGAAHQPLDVLDDVYVAASQAGPLKLWSLPNKVGVMANATDAHPAYVDAAYVLNRRPYQRVDIHVGEIIRRKDSRPFADARAASPCEYAWSLRCWWCKVAAYEFKRSVGGASLPPRLTLPIASSAQYLCFLHSRSRTSPLCPSHLTLF